jgi:hypothetical protein
MNLQKASFQAELAFCRLIVAVKHFGAWLVRSWNAMMRKNAFCWLGYVVVVKMLLINWRMN